MQHRASASSRIPFHLQPSLTQMHKCTNAEMTECNSKCHCKYFKLKSCSAAREAILSTCHKWNYITPFHNSSQPDSLFFCLFLLLLFFLLSLYRTITSITFNTTINYIWLLIILHIFIKHCIPYDRIVDAYRDTWEVQVQIAGQYSTIVNDQIE